jgi:hypothetical protein
VVDVLVEAGGVHRRAPEVTALVELESSSVQGRVPRTRQHSTAQHGSDTCTRAQPGGAAARRGGGGRHAPPHTTQQGREETCTPGCVGGCP